MFCAGSEKMGLHDLQAAASIRCHQQLEVTARLVRTIRGNRPQVEILVRADSHYACPEVLDGCEANGIDELFGLAPSTWKRHTSASGGEHRSPLQGRPERRQGPPLQGILRRRRQLGRVRRIVAHGSVRTLTPRHPGDHLHPFVTTSHTPRHRTSRRPSQRGAHRTLTILVRNKQVALKRRMISSLEARAEISARG